MNASLPVVDVSPLVNGADAPIQSRVAEQIGQACRHAGFFYVVGHQVCCDLQERLEVLSQQFFALPIADKMAIRMELAGRAWRGYFPVGAELTSGAPDQKEGIYFGQELSIHHPKVADGVPMHGANLFPSLPGFRETILQYMQAMSQLGQMLMRGIAFSLGKDADFFRNGICDDPFILFRIFHYPPLSSESSKQWSVGEHTDYGLLTLLRQDQTGGLQVQLPGGWVDAPPLENAFVCNLGDILDLMTGGLYRSTPHRVRNTSGRNRLSFPFFFDPNFDALIGPIEFDSKYQQPMARSNQPQRKRWDGRDLANLSGAYGRYLLGKVAKVFPELSENA